MQAQLSDVIVNTEGGQPSYPKHMPKEMHQVPYLEGAHVLYFDGAFRNVLEKGSDGALYTLDGSKLFGKSFALVELIQTMRVNIKPCSWVCNYVFNMELGD